MIVPTAEELRELLEKAAKAVGYSARTDLTYEDGVVVDGGIVWKPHTDDGASRRLQVALGISVTPYPIYSLPKHSVIAKQHRNGGQMREANPTEVVEVYGDDPEAATRLAVLRCAAAVWDAS